MRKAPFGGANSADNHLARTDNAVDWLLGSEKAQPSALRTFSRCGKRWSLPAD